MNKQELLFQFEQEFESVRKKLQLTNTLEEYDQVFFFRDLILKEGYVSNSLSRILARRIVDTYSSWISHLHSLVFPNHANIFNLKESGFFTETEKEDIFKLLTQIMTFVSTNSVIGLSKDTKKEAEFFQNSLIFWNKTFLPVMLEVSKKISRGWDEISKEEKSNKEHQNNSFFG